MHRSTLLATSLAATLVAGLAATPALAGNHLRYTQEELDAWHAREQQNAILERELKEGRAGALPAGLAPKTAAAPRPGKVESHARRPSPFEESAPGVFEAEARSVALTAAEGGVTVVPLEFGLARPDRSLGYSLSSVRAGAEVLFERAPGDPGAAAELERADTVLYRRGARLEERYQSRPDGFEQTFVLPDPSGLRDGWDLVIEGTLETALAPDLLGRESDVAGIAFAEGGLPVLSVGDAMAIDAAGRRLPLAMTVEGGALRIVVDGAYLADALFPVTVDPLLSSLLYVSTLSVDERNVDVAYSEASDLYLVVWEAEYAADDHDIYGAFYHGDGTSAGGPFAIDDTYDDSLRPSVAWSPNGDRFLVAWEDDVYAWGLNGAYDIYGALIDVPSWTVAGVEIYSSLSTHGIAHVGAEDSPTGKFIVAWTLDYLSLGDYDSAAILVDANGNPGSLIDVETSFDDQYDTTVNKVGSGATPFLVAWTDDRIVSGDLDVWAKTVGQTGALGPIMDVVYTSDDEFSPAVAGAGTDWCVAFVTDLGVSPATGVSDWDVYAQRMDAAGPVGYLEFVAWDVEPEYQPAISRFEPPAGSGSAEYLIAYVSQHSYPSGIYADRVTTTFGMIEDDLAVASTGLYEEQAPAVDARHGNVRPDYFVAWQRDVNTWDIRASRVGERPPQPPVAAFSATPRSGTTPLQVSFTDLSTNAPTAWAWDFQNDGTIDSTVKNPQFTYGQPGTFTVKLTVTNAQGSDSEVKTGHIVVTAAPNLPVADFAASATSGRPPLTVSFTDLSTGTPTAWAWDFQNDGTIDSTVKNPQFTYTAVGTYSVKLTVTGPGGTDYELKTGLIAVTLTANPPQGGAPVADFDASPLSGTAPLTVAFTDRSTGTISSWTWSFGDGVTDTTQFPTHTFATAGTYTIFLTVSGPGGSNTKVRQDYITVTASGAPGSTGSAIRTGSGGGGGGGCAFSAGGSPAGAAGMLLPLGALLAILSLARRLRPAAERR